MRAAYHSLYHEDAVRKKDTPFTSAMGRQVHCIPIFADGANTTPMSSTSFPCR